MGVHGYRLAISKTRYGQTGRFWGYQHYYRPGSTINITWRTPDSLVALSHNVVHIPVLLVHILFRIRPCKALPVPRTFAEIYVHSQSEKTVR